MGNGDAKCESLNENIGKIRLTERLIVFFIYEFVFYNKCIFCLLILLQVVNLN